jgi:hypothetical protein
MSQPYTPPGVTLAGGLWIYVTAANNGQAIDHATFSYSNYNDSGFAPGWYYLICGPNTAFDVTATNYHVSYFNTGSNQSMQVSLSWAGSWPQTQTY